MVNTLKTYYLIFISLLMLFKVEAQSIISADKKKLFKADKAFDMGDFMTALKLYDILYKKDSTDNEMNYKLGICNYILKKDRYVSKKYFDKVPFKEFPETDYYLGILNHSIREYNKAIFYYTRYKKNRTKYHTNKEIDDLIRKSNTAVLYESTADTKNQIINMGDTINTKYNEYAPLIPADESFMIFTSRRNNPVWKNKDFFGEYFEDIYTSKRDSLGWHAPIMLDSLFNTPLHDAGTGLSADGERLLIYRTSDDYKSGDIYESYFKDGKWVKPKVLGSTVNHKGSIESSACFSEQGDIIFFSSDREGGYGGKDLYMAKKLPNGKWGEPYNLGPNINTEYNEDAPFIHPLGNAIFFSSEGHENMGGYDIFKAEFDESGKFSIPKNLGYPVNTVDDDIFFVMNPNGNTGYLSSARDGGFGGQDIYKVIFNVNTAPLSVYNLYVLNESNAVINEVIMEIRDVQTQTHYGTYKSNEHTGKVLFISESKKEYQITIKAEGYDTFVTNVVFYDFNRDKLFTLKKKQN